jgi:hypothetical protein
MKPRYGLYRLWGLIGALALAGCGGNNPGGSMPITVVPANSPVVVPTTVPEAAPTDSAAAYPMGTEAYPYPAATEASPAAGGQEAADTALINLAKKDLAQRLSVTVDQMTVVSSTYMDWPDASLGCAQKGMVYAQVITPGYRIVLEQGQKQYDYHTSLASTVVLCTP